MIGYLAGHRHAVAAGLADGTGRFTGCGVESQAVSGTVAGVPLAKVGVVESLTVTVCVAVLALPAPSVAVQVTV